MIKINYSPYELQPLGQPNARLNAKSNAVVRQGALLQFQWADGLVGYSDLFPWPELGDLNLSQQFESLARGQWTQQLKQSMWLARRDAQARSLNKNLLQESCTLNNNFLVQDFHKLYEQNSEGSLAVTSFAEDSLTQGSVDQSSTEQISINQNSNDQSSNDQSSNNQSSLALSSFEIGNAKLDEKKLPKASNSLGQIIAEIKRQGFKSVKIKVGIDLPKEIELLNSWIGSGLSLRLDFNSCLSSASFAEFIKKLNPEILQSIEYVEDPFPYNFAEWKKAKDLVKLAVDNEYANVDWESFNQTPFDVLIIKPAKVDVEMAIERCKKWKLKATVTSYMDHSVGVAHALAVANELRIKHPEMMLDSGCLTHKIYQPDEFSAQFLEQGPHLILTGGFGIGFDQILESRKWQNLISI